MGITLQPSRKYFNVNAKLLPSLVVLLAIVFVMLACNKHATSTRTKNITPNLIALQSRSRELLSLLFGPAILVRYRYRYLVPGNDE
jgi:hypothetical protein